MPENYSKEIECKKKKDRNYCEEMLIETMLQDVLEVFRLGLETDINRFRAQHRSSGHNLQFCQIRIFGTNQSIVVDAQKCTYTWNKRFIEHQALEKFTNSRQIDEKWKESQCISIILS